jgi:hypothetical protein
MSAPLGADARFKLGARWEPDPSCNCVPCQRYRRAVGMLRTGR